LDGVDDIGPFEGSAVYLFVFGDFDFDVGALEFVELDGLALDVSHWMWSM
jgi:hypothetical protein